MLLFAERQATCTFRRDVDNEYRTVYAEQCVWKSNGSESSSKVIYAMKWVPQSESFENGSIAY